MAVNPDPKPGRWILPLVILGMIAFTYFFVRELPEGSPGGTTPTGAPGTETSTTVAGNGNGNGGGNGGTTGTTQQQSNLAPDIQAYLDTIDGIDQGLQAQRNEMVTGNDAFDADPREIESSELADIFESVITETQALADQLSALTPPAGLEGSQTSLQTAIDAAAGSAEEALAGLRSTDTGQRRRAAVDAYELAADDFTTEVTNTHNAANANA